VQVSSPISPNSLSFWIEMVLWHSSLITRVDSSRIFSLLSKRLLWSHDPGHWFGGLTCVDLSCFLGLFFLFFFQFHLSTLGWFGIELHNLFWFSLYRVIMVSWPGREFGRLTQVDLYQFNMLLSQYFFKNNIVLSFESNYIFTSDSGCLWTHWVDPVTSVQLPLDLNSFMQEKRKLHLNVSFYIKKLIWS
jgi:hypothetical protein